MGALEDSQALAEIIQEVFEAEEGIRGVEVNTDDSGESGSISVQVVDQQISFKVLLTLMQRGYINCGLATEAGAPPGCMTFKRVGNMAPAEIGECLVQILQSADPLIRRGITTTDALGSDSFGSIIHILGGMRPLVRQAGEELDELH